ncbi:MAG: hypothetical protein WAX77_16170 [Methylococcaceae bacterium]
MGSIQAMEAIKLIIGIGDNLMGRLLVIDGLSMEFKIKEKSLMPNLRLKLSGVQT